ncbi:MAG: DUF2079 domain-containing protein [Myxococcota bacterium]|nr:DUF2079 domain-containing protein [Myxococcota bacterium]
MKRALLPLLLLSSLVATVLWSRAQLLALAVYDSQWSQDLAFFHQILWSGTHGGPWASHLLLEPQGLLQMVHFSPMLVLLGPLVWAFDGPGVLLVVNAAMVASAAIPLGLLGARVSKHAGFGALAGLAYLLYMPTLSAAQADFRPMALLVPAFAWLALGAWTRRWGPLLAGAVLAVLAREESAYLLVFAGLVTSLVDWRKGLSVAAIGAGWFALLWGFKGNLFFHFDPSTYAGTITEPPTELVQARWGFVGQSLASGYALAPLGWLPLLIGAPAAGFLWLDAAREWELFTGPYVHLRSVVLACQAAAGTLGAAWVASRAGARWSWAPWVLGVGMCVGNLAAFPGERTRHHQRLADQRAVLESPEHAQEVALLARVGPDDRVATDYRLIAALSGRKELWNASHLLLDEDPPPHWERAWPIGLEPVDTLVLMDDDPLLAQMSERALSMGWEQTARAGSLGIWRRKQPFPDCPADMVPVPGGVFFLGATKGQVQAADWEETWNLPRPIKRRETAGFCMDRHPYPNQQGALPMVWVTWDAAEEICAASGKRLCTEDEWARACSGELGRFYPYGNTHEPGRCQDSEEVGDHDALSPAGDHPGCQSAWGIYDLEGKVSEWVADPHPNDPEVLRVLRGGTMWVAIYGHGCPSRHAHEKDGPTNGDDGFRCCR